MNGQAHNSYYMSDAERAARFWNKLYAKRKRLRFIAIKSSTKQSRVGLCASQKKQSICCNPCSKHRQLSYNQRCDLRRRATNLKPQHVQFIHACIYLFSIYGYQYIVIIMHILHCIEFHIKTIKQFLDLPLCPLISSICERYDKILLY